MEVNQAAGRLIIGELVNLDLEDCEEEDTSVHQKLCW